MKKETTQTGNGTWQFRRMLRIVGISNPESYEWLDGEGWYLGEPIQGRATKSEQRAIDWTKTIMAFPITIEDLARFEAQNWSFINSLPAPNPEKLIAMISNTKKAGAK